MARLYNGMTEEEILAAGRTFSLGTPEVAARGAREAGADVQKFDLLPQECAATRDLGFQIVQGW